MPALPQPKLVLPEKVEELKNAISVMLESNLGGIRAHVISDHSSGKGIISKILTRYYQVHNGTIICSEPAQTQEMDSMMIIVLGPD